MASYGTFISACGFEYNGPNGHIRFAPQLNPQKCKVPFTAAAAWGSYEQNSNNNLFTASLQVKYGSLVLNTFSFDADMVTNHVSAVLNGNEIQASVKKIGKAYTIQFNNKIEIKEGQHLQIKLS